MRDRSVGLSAFLVGTALLLAWPSAADAARASQQSAPAGKSAAKGPVASTAKGAPTSNVKTGAPSSKASSKAAAPSARHVAAVTPGRPLLSTARAQAVTPFPMPVNTGRNRALSPTVMALRGQPLTYTTPVAQSAYRVAYGRGYAAQYRGQLRGNRYAAYSAGRGVGGGGMSCVPYARAVTGMAISGNAWQWWDNAEGQYARGQVPEAGSVLAFRNNMRMPMGHVAVVSHVEGPRVVRIHHANWPVGGRRGAVSQGIAVVDVSDRNDWSAVRVALGHNEDFGSIYPTHGFIYNRADTGAIRTATRAPAPMLALNAPPADLRGRYDRNRARYADRAYDEVAEAPAQPRGTAQRAGYVAPTGSYPVIIPNAVFNGGN